MDRQAADWRDGHGRLVLAPRVGEQHPQGMHVMRLQGSMTCTCDYSLKACMHSSHVYHGLCLTPGGERTGAPRCCESTLACRRRLRPYWHQGRGGAARRGTNRVLRQPAACVRHLRRHTGHRDHVRGLWRAGGACGLGAWRGPAPSAARTRVPKLQPCVPRLQSFVHELQPHVLRLQAHATFRRAPARRTT